jgi:hypothetical protein
MIEARRVDEDDTGVLIDWTGNWDGLYCGSARVNPGTNDRAPCPSGDVDKLIMT